MAREMLRITVMGNLSSDAESRLSAEDRPITHFRIAVNQTRTNPAGGREESTEWFQINVAGRLAEYASGLRKGQRVLVDGRLQSLALNAATLRRASASTCGPMSPNVSGQSPAAETEDARTPVGAAVEEALEEPAASDLPF